MGAFKKKKRSDPYAAERAANAKLQREYAEKSRLLDLRVGRLRKRTREEALTQESGKEERAAMVRKAAQGRTSLLTSTGE